MTNFAMSADVQALFDAALAAQAKAHAPYSHFPVGAALRCENGLIHAGCNIENAAYPSGWCAEPTAISHLIVSGSKEVREIMVIGNSDGPCSPCGLCRQRLNEFVTDPNIMVHMAHPVRGLLKSVTFGELYPHRFGQEHL